MLLLKVKQEEIPDFSGPAYWDIPGGRVQWSTVIKEESLGRIDWDETVKMTLKREIEEETGLVDIDSFEPLSFTISNITYPVESGEIVALILKTYICKVDRAHSIPISLSQEHSEYKWVSLKDAVSLLAVKYSPEFIDALMRLW